MTRPDQTTSPPGGNRRVWGTLFAIAGVALIALALYSTRESTSERKRLEAKIAALSADIERLESDNEELRFGADRLLASASSSFSDGELDAARTSLGELLRRHPHAGNVQEAQELLQEVEAALEAERAEKEKLAKLEHEAAERERARQEAERKRAQKEKQRRLAAAVQHLRKDVDKLEGVTWYHDKSNSRFTNVNSFRVYIGERRGFHWLRLRVQYAASDWLFIDSYFISVDGTKYRPSSMDWERDNGGGKIWEWSDTTPSDSDLRMTRAIIASKNATIRFQGSQYYKDRVIPKQEKQALQRVLDAYEALSR